MIKAVIFDLDGTLYLGKTPIKGAAEKLSELRAKGIKVLFLTNAATRSRANVALKLSNMGFGAVKKDVYCGAYALAKYISQSHKGKKVYFIGESGIEDEFREAGIAVSDDADIVAVGLDRQFSYDKLCRAHRNISKGALFMASNNDHTYPTENGHLPGAGAIIAAVEFACGKKPYIVGKPNPFLLELIMKEHGLKKDEILMVGDRLDTDILFAKNCGIRSALVLSGSTKRGDIRGIVPDYIIESVGDLRV
jgi:HAD superfamily hydrolase (TIGR01457 family)